eukprot:scaffold1601_cov59-Cylindrotheca_fusiformis.AAC.1
MRPKMLFGSTVVDKTGSRDIVRRVRIADNVTSIPEMAFLHCQELEEATLSCSVQVIGKNMPFEVAGH